VDNIPNVLLQPLIQNKRKKERYKPQQWPKTKIKKQRKHPSCPQIFSPFLAASTKKERVQYSITSRRRRIGRVLREEGMPHVFLE
jgi:hypothetical protein